VIIDKDITRVVITGPESTGKTELCARLSKYFNTCFVPEFAREYVENLNRSYTYDDVEFIAREQIILANEQSRKARRILFYDTFLMLTKVWFDVVYRKHPSWLENAIEENEVDFYLLCNTDLKWIPDPVRENGGEAREKLFELYKNELDNREIPYAIVSGHGEARFINALGWIEKKIEK